MILLSDSSFQITADGNPQDIFLTATLEDSGSSNTPVAVSPSTLILLPGWEDLMFRVSQMKDLAMALAKTKSKAPQALQSVLAGLASAKDREFTTSVSAVKSAAKLAWGEDGRQAEYHCDVVDHFVDEALAALIDAIWEPLATRMSMVSTECLAACSLSAP